MSRRPGGFPPFDLVRFSLLLLSPHFSPPHQQPFGTMPDGTPTLIPLTKFDTALADFQFTTCFLVDAKPGELDIEKLEQAIARVVEKWRLLAGRIVLDKEVCLFPLSVLSKPTHCFSLKQRNLHFVRVPIGPLSSDHKIYTLTVLSTPDEPSLFVDSPPLSSSAGVRFPVPSSSLIGFTSSPKSMHDYVKRQLPILTFHIHQFSSDALITLSVPHAVLDGTGTGLVLSALSAELNGEEWDIPPMHEENPFEKRLEEVKRMEVAKEDKEKTLFMCVFPPLILRCSLLTLFFRHRPAWTNASLSNVAQLILNGLYEKFVHHSEEGCVFVGRELLEVMIAETKSAVLKETSGQEFVSENDILANWAFQVRFSFPSPCLRFLHH
jgi:hypothetical protein